jgi:hypothetical protein
MIAHQMTCEAVLGHPEQKSNAPGATEHWRRWKAIPTRKAVVP